MTHEELLAKLDELSTITMWSGNSPVYRKNLALRAVIELHKPVGISWDNDNLACDECADIYPCPTIQAIEKELS